MGYGCDADFEHARLLKLHTSVVVSARSVGRSLGSSSWFGPLIYLIMCALAVAGWVMCLFSKYCLSPRNTPTTLTSLLPSK